ncbi:hypothetical protein JXB31_03615 [Candidatus Woesearchaeota archaeon]|nr:hypothetical protein [Candidatus Woesearchaeota archaeon]
MPRKRSVGAVGAASEAKPKPKRLSKTAFFLRLKTDVPPESCFVLVNGNRIQNLMQLAMEIDKMPDEVFYYHVNDYKNDYMNWVRDVIKDLELCDKIKDIKDKKNMQICLLKHIVKMI